MKPSTFFHLIGTAQAHTIMQSFNGNSQGAGIYMPSDDSVTTDLIAPSTMASLLLLILGEVHLGCQLQLDCLQRTPCDFLPVLVPGVHRAGWF